MKKKFFLLPFLFLFYACIPFDKGWTIDYHGKKEIVERPFQELPKDFVPQFLQVCAIGDSLTVGVGSVEHGDGYLTYLRNRLLEEKGIGEVGIDSFGVNGNRTTHLLNRLEDERLIAGVKRANIVIVTIGGNDMMKIVKDHLFELDLQDFRREMIGYEKRIREIITKLRGINPKALIFYVGLYNPFLTILGNIEELNGVLEEWNQVSERVIHEFDGVYFVDIAEEFKEKGMQFLSEDLFHPNDEGYEYIAEEIRVKMIEALFSM